MQGPDVGLPVFQDELQRVLASATLRNSESLRRLLSYLGEAYLTGTPRPLKEYTIGRDVMGKPEDYDPRVDASVRVQVGKLRQRLEQYYTQEAPAAEAQIRIPRGHFELALERPAVDPAVEARAGRYWRGVALAASAVAVALAAVTGFLLWRDAPVAAPARGFESAEMNRYWQPFLEGPRALTLVLGSPLFVRLHSSYYRDPWVNDWATAQKQLPLAELQKLLKLPTPPTETHRWTPFGEAAAAVRLALVLGPRKDNIVLKRSSVLSWEDVRSTNLIFLGPQKFNPQLKDLPVEQDFVIEGGAVRNLKPRPGEQSYYHKPSEPAEEEIPEEYSVVTRMRGVQGWGEVLVLASTSTEGTWAAAEFVTDPKSLRVVEARLRTREGTMPDCYQILLRSRFKSQVPLQTEYLSHHVVRPKTASE